MDDAFTYRSAVPIRRELDPRLVRAGVALALAAIVVGAFAGWVIESERRSFAGPEPTASRAATEPADDLVPDPTLTTADARAALRATLAAARVTLLTDGSFLAATPSRLSDLQPGYTYVDGPSTTPHIVSVASSGDAWAAAARSPEGGCLWVRVSSAGVTSRGDGVACTGAEVLTGPAGGRSSR